MGFEGQNSAKQRQANTIPTTGIILLYNGTPLTNITLPSNPSLNDVLAAINTAIGVLGSIALVNKTSQITLYDGSLSLGCVTIPSNSSLNDVIALLATAICTNTTDITTNGGATIISDGSQINVPYDTLVGTITNTTVVTSNTGATGTIVSHTGSNLVLTDVTGYFLDNNTLSASGFTAAVNGVSTSVAHALPEADAGHSVPSQTGIIPPALPVIGSAIPITPSIDTMSLNPTDRTIGGFFKGIASKFTFTDLNINQRASYEYLRDTIKGLFNNFTSIKGALSTSGASFTITIAASNYYINGRRLYVASTNKTVTATSDNYADVSYDGTYTITAVPISDPAPAIATNNIRLYKIVTNGAGVTSSVDMQNSYPINGSQIADNSVITRHITDANVTNGKLDNTAVTPNTYVFPTITVNSKGRITAAAKGAVLAGLANRDMLMYDNAAGWFVNIPIMGFVIPNGSDQDIYIFDSGSGAISTKSLATLLAASGQPINTTVSLSAAQLLTGNSIPIQAIAAPGAAFAIEVISACIKYTYGVAAYTADNISLIIDTGTQYQAVSATILSNAASVFVKILPVSQTTGQFVANKALMIKTNADGSGGVPTGTAKVYITYRIITI